MTQYPQSELVKKLRDYANDPMWANHAEVPKTLLTGTASYIEFLERELTDAEASMKPDSKE